MTARQRPSRASAEERERIAREGMYRPDFEGDACGVGLVAATDGKPSRRVVAAAIDALKAVWHRGAVDADGKTGDGAGIHVELPLKFFDDAIAAPATGRGRPARASAWSSCRAPISARRSAAAPSSRPRSSTSATPSMAGARCRSTSR